MEITRTQIDNLGRLILLNKIDKSMKTNVVEFSELSDTQRMDFLNLCYEAAISRGLLTEQGIASYALTAWFLDIKFETKSNLLLEILGRKVPEIRKVYAMNEWASALIGKPHDPGSADERLLEAFEETTAWGQ